MANPSQNPTPQSAHAHENKGLCSKTKHKSQHQNWLWSTLALGALFSSAGLTIAFIWISIVFIVNPQHLGWINKFLPEWGQIPVNTRENPQTFQEIEDSLSKQQIAGKLLPLDPRKRSFLLPIFQQRFNCQSNCQKIVELRVYQEAKDIKWRSQPKKYYHLTSQLPITPPDESLLDPALQHQDHNTPLPLTEIEFLGSDLSPGVWLVLWGQPYKKTGAIAYGYIIYYNPQHQTLQQVLSWKNPNGQLPKWQQVTGGGAKELVIDQTIGLEPKLSVYQIKSTEFYLNPLHLAEISLKAPGLQYPAYQDALFIARSGLWTPAFEWLQFIEKQRQSNFPPPAQAQVDLIRLHSQLTKAQADITWASPSQQVLAQLLDGRWAKALQVLEASPHNTQEIASLLKADTGRLWNRAVAALRVNPTRGDVQAWAALILAAQRGEKRASSWLKSQPQITPAHLDYIQDLLAQLKSEVAKP